MEYNQRIDELICATSRRKENYQYEPKLLRNWCPLGHARHLAFWVLSILGVLNDG